MPKSWHHEQKRLQHHRTAAEKARRRTESLSTSYGRMMARKRKK